MAGEAGKGVLGSHIPVSPLQGVPPPINEVVNTVTFQKAPNSSSTAVNKCGANFWDCCQENLDKTTGLIGGFLTFQ